MKLRCLILLLAASLMLAPICKGEDSRWFPRKIDAPKTPLQQALYDLALEQTQALVRSITSAGFLIEAEQRRGGISEALFAYLEDAEHVFAQPRTVLLMLPTAGFPSGTSSFSKDVDSFEPLPESLWGSMGMFISYMANSAYGERSQAEFLELLSIYDARELPAARGMALVFCLYAQEMPHVLTTVQLSESDGPSICKTSLVLNKYMEESFLEAGMAINLFGDESFECVYLKPGE